MLLYLFWYILFIPIILGNFIASGSSNATKEISLGKLRIDTNNKTQTLVSEGGSTIQSVQPLVSPEKKDHTLPITLDNVLNDETAKHSTSKIVSRNGVNPEGYPDIKRNPTDLKQVKSPSSIDENSKEASTDKEKIAKTDKKPNITTSSEATVQTKLTTEKPKVTKPHILSYDDLASSDKGGAKGKWKATPVLSSSETSVPQQMPSPKDGEATTKIQPMDSSRHPDMVMPVVFTILVVPMIAVLGYMGLRRGQELWKNRHYKRMDFLLDGMYND